MDLKPCPSSPNCISSQAEPSDSHFMAPVEVSGSAAVVLDAVADVLGSEPGAKITERSADRIESVFTTKIFRFKDDVVFAVDEAKGELHFRSASRVGSSDLGANKKRLKALIPKIQAKL